MTVIRPSGSCVTMWSLLAEAVSAALGSIASGRSPLQALCTSLRLTSTCRVKTCGLTFHTVHLLYNSCRLVQKKSATACFSSPAHCCTSSPLAQRSAWSHSCCEALAADFFRDLLHGIDKVKARSWQVWQMHLLDQTHRVARGK